MKKKQLTWIIFTILLLIIFLGGLSIYRQSLIPPHATFDQEYAQENIPLTVSCYGYKRSTTFAYTWKIDGIIIDNLTDSYTPTHNDLGKFISVSIVPSDGSETQELCMYFSSLPVFYVDVLDGGPIWSKDEYFEANIRMQGNHVYNTTTTDLYEGYFNIKGRGNTSWRTDKRAYKFRLEEEVDLMGMGANKHWILHSIPFDNSLMRNTIAYDLSGELGMPHMKSTWVDLVVNGEYLGIYQLCEQIRIDKTRVDITDLEDYSKYAIKALIDANAIDPAEKDALKDHMKYHMEWLTSGIIEFNGQTYDLSKYMNLPEIDGGFLFELDAFYDEPTKFMIENQPIQILYPEFIGTNSSIMQYAYDFVYSFYEATYLSDTFYAGFRGDYVHYTQLFDIDSLVKYFLMTEVFFNEDTGLKSTYFYKDLGGLAHMGPVWDMDYSSGGAGKQSYVYDQWQVNFYSNYSQWNWWYKGIVRDPYFLSKVLESWETYRDIIFNIIAEDGPMEEAYDYIYDSALANFRRWLEDTEQPADAPINLRFETGYLTFKNWMTNHLAWLDSQFTTLDHLVESIGAFDAGYGVSMTRFGQTVMVTAEEGDTVVFYFNGIRQQEVPLTNGTASFSVDPMQQTMESDVIQARVYSEDGTQIGSDFVDFR